MYDFKTVLEHDEQILYQSKAYPGKGSKSVMGDIIVIVFNSLILLLLYLSIKYKIGDGADGITLNILIFIILCGGADLLCIFHVIYTLWLKDYASADDYCCVTNKRILKYEERSDRLTSVYIHEFDTFEVAYTFHGYGDAVFYKKMERDELNVKELSRRAWNAFVKKNHSAISFNNVKNPRKAVSVARQRYSELKWDGVPDEKEDDIKKEKNE